MLLPPTAKSSAAAKIERGPVALGWPGAHIRRMGGLARSRVRCGGKAAAAAALCALVLGAPAPASARVTVSVQIAYGAVVVGGVGVFIAIDGSWLLPFASREPAAAVLEFSGEGLRAGMPIPTLSLESDAADGHRPAPGVRIDLVRWRF